MEQKLVLGHIRLLVWLPSSFYGPGCVVVLHYWAFILLGSLLLPIYWCEKERFLGNVHPPLDDHLTHVLLMDVQLVQGWHVGSPPSRLCWHLFGNCQASQVFRGEERLGDFLRWICCDLDCNPVGHFPCLHYIQCCSRGSSLYAIFPCLLCLQCFVVRFAGKVVFQKFPQAESFLKIILI